MEYDWFKSHLYSERTYKLKSKKNTDYKVDLILSTKNPDNQSF